MFRLSLIRSPTGLFSLFSFVINTQLPGIGEVGARKGENSGTVKV